MLPTWRGWRSRTRRYAIYSFRTPAALIIGISLYFVVNASLSIPLIQSSLLYKFEETNIIKISNNPNLRHNVETSVLSKQLKTTISLWMFTQFLKLNPRESVSLSPQGLHDALKRYNKREDTTRNWPITNQQICW